MNFDKLKNKTLEEAKKLAEKDNFKVREIMKDGKPIPVTADFSINRINVGTKNGKITDIYEIG